MKNYNKIPKKITLAGMEYKVTRMNSTEGELKELNAYGLTYNRRQELIVLNDKQVSDDMKKQIYLHELTHAILDTLYRADLSDDEMFVDNFSQLLYQSLKTSEF